LSEKHHHRQSSHCRGPYHQSRRTISGKHIFRSGDQNFSDFIAHLFSQLILIHPFEIVNVSSLPEYYKMTCLISATMLESRHKAISHIAAPSKWRDRELAETLKDKACIVGIGETEYSKNSGRSEMRLAWPSRKLHRFFSCCSNFVASTCSEFYSTRS